MVISMVDAPTWLELVLLAAVVLASCFIAFALTAHRVGGWQQLRAQLTSPELPTRYLVLVIPVTVGATLLIDPMDSLSGTGWVTGVLTFLVFFFGSLWRVRRHTEGPKTRS